MVLHKNMEECSYGAKVIVIDQNNREKSMSNKLENTQELGMVSELTLGRCSGGVEARRPTRYEWER